MLRDENLSILHLSSEKSTCQSPLISQMFSIRISMYRVINLITLLNLMNLLQSWKNNIQSSEGEVSKKNSIFNRNQSIVTFSTFAGSLTSTIMKSYRKELWFDISQRRQLINITPEVQSCLAESGVQEGLILVNAMHISASVFINDDESGLHHDFEIWLEKLAPEKPHSQYHHNGYEDNADAHLKRTIMGREVVVAVTDGQMDFGPWEQIFYGEFDGKRRKRVLVKIIGD